MKKNTALTIGITGCSFFFFLVFLIFFFNSFVRTGRACNSLNNVDSNNNPGIDSPGIPIIQDPVGTPLSRKYEIQFHVINLHKKLDYTRLNAMGITKIIYRVFEDLKNGGLYFNTTEFWTLQPALEQLIAEFDFKRLHLCAWMIGRNFKWLSLSESSLFDCQYENERHQLIPRLDLFNPEAVRKIIAVYKELASRKIDAILIQDDFMLRYNEGFSNWGKAQFAAVMKIPAVEKLMIERGTPYNEAWKRVKREQLLKVLKAIVDNCKMVNSAIKIGINIYYETPVFPQRASAWYAHDLSEILNSGVDYIYLMSYQRQIKDEMNWNEDKNRVFFKETVEKAYDTCKEKLVVKLQIRDWNTAERIPIDEVLAYLDLIPATVEHVCLTPVKVEDYDYLEELIEAAAKNAKKREG